MIDTQEALRLLTGVSSLPPRVLPLAEALGHVLSEDIRADRDIPPADRSAMDGYAIRALDLDPGHGPFELRQVGEIAAGSSTHPVIEPGDCVRIMTGGNVPPGTDTVVMEEMTESHGEKILIRGQIKTGANIIRRGEDARTGDLLLPSGTVIGPLQIGVAATIGRIGLAVHDRPRLAIVCTGDELRPVGEAVEAHQVRNSNGPALEAALAVLGYRVTRSRIARDRLDELVAELTAAIEAADVVLLTGGVSKGKFDFVRAAVEQIGAEIIFHGIAMKPGKPLLCARLPGHGGHHYLFGLSGNPLSTMTGFYEFVLPTLRRLSGLPATDCRPAFFLPVTARLTSKGGRTHFLLARLEHRQNGLAVAPVPSHSSSDLVSGGRSDGVIVLGPQTREVEAGATVEFHSWKPLI